MNQRPKKIRRKPGEIYKGHTIYQCHTDGVFDLFWDIEPGGQEFAQPEKARAYIDAKMAGTPDPMLPPTRQEEQERALNEVIGRGVRWLVRKATGRE